MVENPRVTDEQNGAVITEDEAALYDRQIRLWGLDAQKRLEYRTCLRVVKIHLSLYSKAFVLYAGENFVQNYVNSMLNIKINILI